MRKADRRTEKVIISAYLDRTEKKEIRKKATLTYNNALRRGDVKRMPCRVCGSERTDGHHTDYSKPLNVQWLCKLHHMEAHSYIRSTGSTESQMWDLCMDAFEAGRPFTWVVMLSEEFVSNGSKSCIPQRTINFPQIMG